MKNISEETLPPPPSTAKTNSTINEKNVICKLLHKGDAFELLNLLNAALGRYKKTINGHEPDNHSQLKQFKMTCVIEEI